MINPFETLERRLIELQESVDQLLLQRQAAVTTVDIPADDKRLSIDQLAKYLCVSKVTVLNYKKRGAIPYHQVGRKVYFIQSEVDKALSSQKRKGAPRG